MATIDDLKDQDGHLNRDALKKIIPYDDHFLMIDSVIELKGKQVIAVKKIIGSEDYLAGHFVGFPIMPGALIVEGIGQAATLLVRYNLENHEQKDILAHTFKKVEFLYPTLPQDELRYEIALKKLTANTAVVKAKAFNVKLERLIAQGTFTLAIVDRVRFREKFTRT